MTDILMLLLLVLFLANAIFAEIRVRQERKATKMWKHCAEKREGQINELLTTCETWHSVCERNEKTIATLRELREHEVARRAAKRIFDLFKNASYFSTRNAEHKSQMLDGWAALIDEEFSASTPRETAASGEARLRQELQEIYDEDDCVEQIGARCARCESIMAALAAAPALPQVTEPDMWWLWDDSEQEIENDDPDEYLAEYAAENEILRFQTAHRGSDKWAFRRAGQYFYFDSKQEAENALANRPAPAAPEKE